LGAGDPRAATGLIMVRQGKSRGDMDIPSPGVVKNSGPHLDQTLHQPVAFREAFGGLKLRVAWRWHRAKKATFQVYRLFFVITSRAQSQSPPMPFPRSFPGEPPVDPDQGSACSWAIRRRCGLGSRRISARCASPLPGCGYQLASPPISLSI